MPISERTRLRPSADKLTAEFTSGQLVIAICVSLFFALTCFLLGVLVGKYDNSLRAPDLTAQAPAAPGASETMPAPLGDILAKQKAEGVQQSPRTDLRPNHSRRKTSRDSRTENPFTPRDERSGPRVRDMAPLPPPGAESAPPSAPPFRVTIPAEADTASEKETIASMSSASPPVSETTTDTPVSDVAAPLAPETTASSTTAEPPKDSSPLPLLQPVQPPDETTLLSPAMPAAAPPAETKGKFCIQLASFRGSERQAKAEEHRRLLKQQAGIDSELLILENDEYCRVVIGGYTSRAAANAACMELRKKAGFADVFVRALP